MRPLPSSRESTVARGDYTDSAATSQCLETSSCFLVTEAEMDLELDTGSKMPRGRSVLKCDPATQRNVTPSPVPSSPVANSTRGTTAEFSVPNTPPLFGLSRPESSLSFISSPRNCSSSSSAIDRDSSIENAIITQQHIEAYQDLPPSSAGSSVPQFIMPNMRIPRRRPFTDVGRSLGKLRLLVLGSPGLFRPRACRQITNMSSRHRQNFHHSFDIPMLRAYCAH